MLLTCYPGQGGGEPTYSGESWGAAARRAAQRTGRALGAGWPPGHALGLRRHRPRRERETTPDRKTARPPAGPRRPDPGALTAAGATRPLMPSLALSTSEEAVARAACAGSELLVCFFPLSAPPSSQCQGLMSEECGRTAALAAGRTRKGAGEEGLVSGQGHGCWQDWRWGGGPGRRAVVPRSFPDPTGSRERVEGGSGTGRGGVES